MSDRMEIFRGPNPPPDPDSNGYAALLLVESLIHGLVSQSVITLPQAIRYVDIAAEVARNRGDELGGGSANNSAVLLETISHSLSKDLE